MISPLVFPVLLTIGCILSATVLALEAIGPGHDRRARPLKAACLLICLALVVVHMLGGVQ